MNPLNQPDLARQDARTWSARLGNLAGQSPALQLETFSPPLSAVLQHLRQRHQRQQDAADKLRANEFILGA